jgi:hypothetical protein
VQAALVTVPLRVIFEVGLQPGGFPDPLAKIGLDTRNQPLHLRIAL